MKKQSSFQEMKLKRQAKVVGLFTSVTKVLGNVWHGDAGL